MSNNYSPAYIKQRTIEIYDSLPMDKEKRIACTKERDEIIELNYTFFGYVASTTFVENVPYEDKFQTALMSFLSMWWKYKWTPKYRDDLSFAVFFKPRIAEEIRRYNATVSYTRRRGVCTKAAKQLGKHWSEVTYDDLSKVNLPADQMLALKAVLGAHIPVDMSECEIYLYNDHPETNIENYRTDKYNSIEELIIQEMIENESQLSDKHIKKMSNIYGISYAELKAAYPKALQILHKRLTDNLDD